MLKLTVHNIGPVASAEILIDAGITLVGAVNEAGKSTILAAAAGSLTGQPLIFPDVVKAKKDATLLLRDGTKAGKISIVGDGGDTVMTYPAATVEGHGQSPTARPNSVGLAPFLSLSDKDRAKVLSSILRSEPSKEDLATALKADDVAEDDIGDVLEILADKGWDDGHDFVSTEWTKAKGAWESMTKTRYGAAKAAAWTPAEWTEALADAKLEDLELAAAQAKTALEHARSNKAVDQAEIARLTALSDEMRDRQAKLDELALDAQTKFNALEEAKTRRAALPAGEADAGIACPHCSAPVIVRPTEGKTFVLLKADPVDGEELKKRRLALAGADGEISRLSADHGEANRALIAAQAAVREAEEAGKKLAAQQKGKPGDTPADGEVLRKAEEAHSRAEIRVSVKKLKIAADAKHAQIALFEKVRAHFAPDGLRQAKLAETLTAFNDGPLAELAETAGWKRVTIRPDMSVLSGGHAIMSVSARWRAETVLAVAFARLGGSPLVILDGADVNVGETREGLIQLLEHVGLPALVGMSFSGRGSMPDLGAAGLGRSYWVQDGIAQLVSQEQKAAA